MKATGPLITSAVLAIVIRAFSTPDMTLQIADYAVVPITGSPDGAGNNAGSLVRVNVMRKEPAPPHRFFVNDLAGPLYILDRTTKVATKYLDLNGRHRAVRGPGGLRP
jgi:hypothetical protein